jgi:TRAP-type C4-dicarboxylate transport system permease small subunit
MAIRKVATTTERGIRSIEKVLAFIGIFMLMMLMFLGTADVIGRYVFNSPITGGMEISQLLMMGVGILCWAYVQETKSYINVDILCAHYPPTVKRLLDIAILFLTIALFGLIAWQSTLIAITDLKQNRVIETILIPQWPFKLMVPFGSTVLCLECIIQIIDNLTQMKGKVR